MWIEPTSYSAAKLGATDSCARRNAPTPMGTEMIVRAVSVMRLLLLVCLKGLKSTDGNPATNRRWNRRHESGLSGRLLLLYPEEKKHAYINHTGDGRNHSRDRGIRANGADQNRRQRQGQSAHQRQGHDPVCLRQGFWRQVSLQWPMRRQLAALDGCGRRDANGRLQRHHARRWQQAVGLQRPPALYLERRQEAGRHHRRWFRQRRLAHCSTVTEKTGFGLSCGFGRSGSNVRFGSGTDVALMSALSLKAAQAAKLRAMGLTRCQASRRVLTCATGGTGGGRQEERENTGCSRHQYLTACCSLRNGSEGRK